LVVSLVLVGVALLFTGGVVGLLSGSSPAKRGLRQLAIGIGAAEATYLLGLLFGTGIAWCRRPLPPPALLHAGRSSDGRLQLSPALGDWFLPG
jgi:hypothetical protein